MTHTSATIAAPEPYRLIFYDSTGRIEQRYDLTSIEAVTQILDVLSNTDRKRYAVRHNGFVIFQK